MCVDPVTDAQKLRQGPAETKKRSRGSTSATENDKFYISTRVI